jgi:hypothetical protein
MSTVVVPLGFESGVIWLDGEAQHQVTLPDASATLPKDTWLVWWSAFADSESAAAHTLTRQRLAEVTAKLGVASSEGHIKALYADGLLVDFDVSGPEEFFRHHKLYPLADGLGEVEKESGTFQIAREGNALLEVNLHVYAIWCMSMYDSSLWATITRYASDINAPVEEVVESVAHALPAIVANRCGFLQSS